MLAKFSEKLKSKPDYVVLEKARTTSASRFWQSKNCQYDEHRVKAGFKSTN